jgi:broad specificity phosphatase PhoE
MAVPELPPGATLVTLLRHGEVKGRAHVMRGDQDDPLSERGHARMRAVLARLEVLAPPGFALDAISTSPRRRCQEFAQIWARERDVPLHVVDGFRELSFGAWEGLTSAEAASLDPEGYRQFRDSMGRVAPPGGESVQALRERVLQAWEAWLGNAQGGHRLLVTHAGVMRALLMELAGLPTSHAWRVALPEAAHFQVSLMAGEAPILLNLNPCAA